MKFKSFMIAATAMACVTFCSCRDDEEKEKEYLFFGSYTVNQPAMNIEEQESIIRTQLVAEGFSSDKLELTLMGEDSIAVVKQLDEKMKRVEKALKESSTQIIASVRVKGGEKDRINPDAKVSNIYSYYNGNFGLYTLTENVSCYPLLNSDTHSHADRFIRSIHSSNDTYYGQNAWSINYDVNDDAGGDYIYLVFDDGTQGEPITDVICVVCVNDLDDYTDCNRITFDGVEYYRPQGMGDLNKGAGGDYVYLFITHSTKNGNLRLTTGRGKYSPRLLRDACWVGHEDYNAERFLPTQKDSGYVWRVVQQYRLNVWNKTLNQEGEADLNNHAGGYYIKMQLPYI